MRKSCFKKRRFVIKINKTYYPIWINRKNGHNGAKTQKSRVTVYGFRVQRFRVHVKSDPLIREHCNLPRQCHLTAVGKTRENNLIAYEQDQSKKGNPER